MRNPSFAARVINKISRGMYPMLATIRRKRLNNTDFTIISNNCWGGVCYEYYGLQKQSPTVGTYFYAKDYIKFINNLKYYTSKEIVMTDYTQSVHKSELEKRGETDVWVGHIDDIEIIFLHYKDKDIAKSKWERRCKRINWDNIILKFSYMNECTDEDVHNFEQITGAKKFVFVSKPFEQYDDAILIEGYEGGQILNDTFYWNGYFDVNEFINRPICLQKGN